MASSDPLVPKSAKIAKYEMPVLDQETPSYSEIKKTFDPEVAKISGSRFMLSEQVQNQLSVEEEEHRRFLTKVEEEVEKLRGEAEEQARQEGFQKGYDEGKAEALEKEKARIASLKENLFSSVQALIIGKQRLADHYDKSVVDLAYKMAQVIVEREVRDRPASISSVIRNILERMSQDEDVRIRLSEVDIRVVEEIRSDIEGISRHGRVNFEIDNSLKPGDCVVASASGEIAAFMEEKLARLKNELERQYPDSDAEEESDSSKTGTEG